MKLLKSDKFTLPRLYFIDDRSKIKDIPPGTQFIYGDPSVEEYIIRLLEYEVLYKKAVKSGLPLKFKQILLDNGFTDLKDFNWCNTTFVDYDTSGDINLIDTNQIGDGTSFIDSPGLAEYIKDSVAVLDIQKVKELNLMPIWLEDMDKAVHTNIHNFLQFNPNMYNKKLGGMYGGITFESPKKNLVILDISPSIPKGIGSTWLVLAKQKAETCFADIMITGRKTILVDYNDLHTLDIDRAYELYGGGQERKMFKALVTAERKVYGTAIVTGDNNHPGDAWGRGDSYISDTDGKKICKWEVDKILSFHTTSETELAGYARWFDVKEEDITRIKDWVKYL